MRITTNDFAIPTTHRGLYQVWVRADETKGAPLVARWIDSRTESLESQGHEHLCGEHTEREVSLDLEVEIFCGRDRL